MRIKSQWFSSERARSPAEIAGASAFIAWRLAQHVLRNMRRADFEIRPGAQYFDFLAEWLIFLIQIADRIAYERLGAKRREAFVTALANRVGEILADNRDELLGAPDGGSEADTHKRRFIDLLNLRSADYADFEFTARGIDYGFLRYLADRLSHVVDARDAPWVRDQVMEIEAPDAVALIRKGMAGLLDDAPRPAARHAVLRGD